MSEPQDHPPIPPGSGVVAFDRQHPFEILQGLLAKNAAIADPDGLAGALAGCRLLEELYGPWDPDNRVDLATALVDRYLRISREVEAVEEILREYFAISPSALAGIQVYRVGEEFYAATSPEQAIELHASAAGDDPSDMPAVELVSPDAQATWRSAVCSGIVQGNLPPFWVGSTYD